MRNIKWGIEFRSLAARLARIAARGRAAFGSAIIGATLAAAVWGSAMAETRTFEFRPADGKLASGEGVVRNRQEDELVLNLISDRSGQLHIHGYDLAIDLAAGKVSAVKFDAYATGRFPVTSHGFGDDHHDDHHDVLFYIEVLPR